MVENVSSNLDDHDEVDEVLAFEVVSGRPHKAIADARGITTRSLHRRLQKPELALCIKQLRRACVQEALGKLESLLLKSAQSLEQLLDNENPVAALGAARVVFDQFGKLSSLCDLEERLTALENHDGKVP